MYRLLRKPNSVVSLLEALTENFLKIACGIKNIRLKAYQHIAAHNSAGVS